MKKSSIISRFVVVFLILVILGSCGVIAAKASHNGRVMFGMSAADGREGQAINTWDVVRYGDAQKPYPLARKLWYSIKRLLPHRTPKISEKRVNPMATYYVGQQNGVGTDPGDTSYLGTYTASGTQNGKPTYTNGSRWLWYLSGPSDQGWVLSASVDGSITFETMAYVQSPASDTPDLGTWYVSTGTSPAPTVTEYVAPALPPDYAYWSDSGGVLSLPSASNIATCRATLGGTSYVVFPHPGGFALLAETAGVWHEALVGTGNSVDGTASFDALDGTHVWVVGIPGFDALGHHLICTKYALTVDTSATVVSTVTVDLPSGKVTNLVRMADGSMRFVLVDGANVSLCSYTLGASTYSTVVTYASGTDLPEGFEPFRFYTGSTYNEQVNHALYLRGTTLYWMRRAVSPQEQRIVAYEVNDTTCVMLDDLMALSVGATGSSYGVDITQTWGYFADDTTIWGDASNESSFRWVPGDDAANVSVMAGFMGNYWYVDGEPLLLTGWVRELGHPPYGGKPFVLQITADELIIPTASMQTTAYSPAAVTDIDVVLTAEGTGGGSGDVSLHITQPVLLEAEGTGGGSGDVTLIGATHIVPEEGEGGGSGEVTLHSATYPEGGGSYAELKLTPGVWPGAARKVAVPSYFDRSQRRHYGGRLSTSRPTRSTGIDESNPLAQYATFWSWMAPNSADYKDVANAVITGSDALQAKSQVAEPNWEDFWVTDGLTTGHVSETNATWIQMPDGVLSELSFTTVVDFTVSEPEGNQVLFSYSVIRDLVSGDVSLLELTLWHDIGTGEVILDYWEAPDKFGNHHWLVPGLFVPGSTHRLILSLAYGDTVTLTVDGVPYDAKSVANWTFRIDYWETSWEGDLTFNIGQGTALLREGVLDATLHEFGYLSGYAATAEDVATNPALAMRYGLRGSATPTTDRLPV